MKKLLLAGFAVSVLIGPAVATDVAPCCGAPPLLLLPWTGFYVGANAGWASSWDSITNNGTDTAGGGLGTALALGVIPAAVGVSYSGFTGGGQIGYNWQVGTSFVWGVETDFDGVSAKGTVISASPGKPTFVPAASGFSRSLDAFGTLRAKVGYLSAVNLLWYATAGLAYGETKIASSWSCPTCAPPASTSAGGDNTAVGWTVGAGVEWKFTPAWSVKAEYLYIDLGNQSDTITYNYGGNVSTLTSTVNQRDNIVRAGVNYKFF